MPACRPPSLIRRLLSVTPRHALIACVLLLSCPFAAQASEELMLIKPGDELAVVDTAHLHVLAPADEIEQLKPFIARADLIYVRLARDAGYEITHRLTLLLSDDAETHNGFSTTIPVPIVNIDLAPATQASFIYTGGDELERTFTHELTHHLSNDRDPNPFRHVMQEIFGRILPFGDPISLIMAYLDIPAHATMPSFWQEGCAQWSETVYAPPGSPWGGRGRDSLTHMVWRLDAASPEGIPEVSKWRLTQQRWPFGTEVYIYGIAYLRYLDAAYGDRYTIWQFIERQEHRWPFQFNGGPVPLLGKEHTDLIEEARNALMAEQLGQLALIRTQPVTVSRRLTDVDGVVSAPAWTADGRLFAAYNPPYGDPHFIKVAVTPDGSGRISTTGLTSWSQGDARSLPDGTLTYTETHASDNPWARSMISVITPGGHVHRIDGPRMVQDDVRHVGTAPGSYQIAGLHLLPASLHDIVLENVSLNDHFFGSDSAQGWSVFPTQGIPWSPAFRPHADELTWIETDERGSTLLLAPLAAPGTRTVLARVAGRILQPVWNDAGTRLFICSDVSGVANAYCIDPDKPGVLVPVTNTIGGVLACVPKHGGGAFAIIDCDSHGPYLAEIPDDPALWPAAIPAIHLLFPAPLARTAPRFTQLDRSAAHPAGVVGGAALADASAAFGAVRSAPHASPAMPAGAGVLVAPAGGSGGDLLSDAPSASDSARWSLPSDAGDSKDLVARPYHGLEEVRPLFWTPTEFVVPSGGIGVIGMAADPVFTHEFITGVGAGLVNGTPVGMASYDYSGQWIDMGVVATRSQLGYDHIVEDVYGNFYDYAENVNSVEALAGYNLNGLARRYLGYVGVGVSDTQSLDSYTNVYRGVPLATPPALTGRDTFVNATVAFDSSSFYPTSYTYEEADQFAVTAQYNHWQSGYRGASLLGIGTKIISVIPSAGHQLVFGGIVGVSSGQRTLQGQFAIGGYSGIGLPRGYYYHTVAVGNYATAGSVAYRLPVYRPFAGFSTSPFVIRQVTVEGFYDTAKASEDHLFGDGTWYSSVGAELRANLEFWTAFINPGLIFAQQLEDQKKFVTYFSLDYQF